MEDKIINLKKKLLAGIPVLMDGGTATELERCGIHICDPEWTAVALLTEQGRDALLKVHCDYVEAGADIITANTFNANPYSVCNFADGRDLDSAELVRDSINIAKEAVAMCRQGRSVLIAGSIGPVGDAYIPDSRPDEKILREDHAAMVDHLAAAGADLILVETMNNWMEIEIVSKYCHDRRIPFMVSIVCGEDGLLLNGDNFTKLADLVDNFSPLAICVNCSSLNITKLALDRLSLITDLPLGAYPNIEDRLSDRSQSDPKLAVTSYQLSEFIRESVNKFNLSIIGGCCGSTPEHIQALRKLIDENII
ncbi:MAG: hypothetical protein CMK83_10290 [Pseudomonadales bacterium]|nr:hypothetical protein [Pseudomonadales bacterium]MEC8814015.1 homocysteine S-methyltransferase family protein [Pseudomonadota bacterium]HAG96167.1 hypothetical protein [Gammaproteobacteria bacterium]HCE74992.1 hypothetical protein [Dehalococcoidia bacterium]|tara:strand:- start:297 stop:1223 length:927 start_codon:yes stop_codon:yes gene_type:complete